MFDMSNKPLRPTHTNRDFPTDDGGGNLPEPNLAQLGELARLRKLAISQAESLRPVEGGGLSEAALRMIGPDSDVISEFIRLASIVRQVVALEMEVEGTPLSPSDDPSDDLDESNRGPIDQVVAKIRKSLGAEPPTDDPFATPTRPRLRFVASSAKKGAENGAAQKPAKDILVRTTHTGSRTVH
jgi:hypothetical protein